MAWVHKRTISEPIRIRIVSNVVDHLKCVHVVPDDDQKIMI
jgi:hypothetical protein